MTGQTITLGSKWTVGKQIGDPSGFGLVFEAVDESGTPGAIKFVPKTPGSARELLFESLAGAQNVVPIVDSGEMPGYYVIVMPLATTSLRGHLKSNGPKLDAAEVVAILTDVATGLVSLERDVVHRDIKPENILLLDGKWSIADFGIARYADASTEPETRKHIVTKRYGAPEQWRGEHATNRADVYALGITGYEMLTGATPFGGPSFREQHLNEAPKPPNSGYRALDGIILDCLRKSAPARPSPGNLLNRLRTCMTTVSPASEKLRDVDQALREHQARQDAIRSEERSVAEARSELFKDSEMILADIVEQVVLRVQHAAPSVTVKKNAEGTALTLSHGELRITDARQVSPNVIGAFDVVAYSDIFLFDERKGSGRNHSLWYCDAYEEGIYRWYELSFMHSGFVGSSSSVEPFAIEPNKASTCFTPITASLQLAWLPYPIDQDGIEPFIERWIEWFALAAAGQYQRPSYMPDEPQERKGRFRVAAPIR